MKLEIRKNFDNDLAELKGKVSKKNPLLGILIGEAEVNGRKSRKVLAVSIGKTIKEIAATMNLKDTDNVELVDLR